VLNTEPQGSYLTIHIFPTERFDFSESHPREIGKASHVGQVLWQCSHQALQFRPLEEALAGVVLRQKTDLGQGKQQAPILREP